MDRCAKFWPFSNYTIFLTGGQKIFFGGPTPKPEVELAAEEGGICRAMGEV